MAKVMIVVPDAAAVQRIAGSLGYLSARKYRVHVGVQEDPPGAPSLELFHGRYPGLSVGRLPVSDDSPWSSLRSAVRGKLNGRPDPANGAAWLPRNLRLLEQAIPPSPEAVAVLEEQKPNLLVVTRLRGREALHLDYLRAARGLGIRSVFLALDCDDVELGGIAAQQPDCVAVWNRVQRREAVEQGVPVRRTCVIGAHLLTDVLDVRSTTSRNEYCARLGIEPERRLVLVAPPSEAATQAAEWVDAWNASRLSCADAASRDSAVIAFARSRETASAIAAVNLPGVADVIDADAHHDRYVAAQRLHEALAHVDAVVTADADIALEGIARARPVIAVVRDESERLARLCARMRQEYEWPIVARSLDEQIRSLAALLNGAVTGEGLRAARGFVRIHGDEVEPAFLLIARVIREIPPPRPPEPVLQRHARAATWLARAARVAVEGRAERIAPHDGRSLLFLLALPSAAALDAWESLMAALVSRGHRVLVVFAAGEASAAGLPVTSRIHGVATLGTVIARNHGWRGIASGVSALALFLPGLQSTRSGTGARWRARLEGAALPAWVSGIQTLEGRDTVLERARRLAAIVEANLPLSRRARRLIDRHHPDAILALPSLDPASAVESWASHAALVRAARSRGIPAAASMLGTTAIDESLAQCALRARGLSRANAAIAVDDIEQWLEAERRKGRKRTVPRVVRAIAASGALGALIWAGAAVRALESQMRPAVRVASRARSGARAAIRRFVGNATR